MQLAKSIDEVITLLESIIQTESKANSNLAYFPVLYKKVTERIKFGIENNEFENNSRMEIFNQEMRILHQVRRGRELNVHLPERKKKNINYLIVRYLLSTIS